MLNTEGTQSNDRESRSKWLGRILLHLITFFVTAIFAGTLCGFGWQVDSLSLLGIVGLGVFLAWQGSCRKLIPCLLHALLTGYVGFAIANVWMPSTIEILSPASEETIFYTSQAVHLLHAGIFVAFSLSWWISRRYLKGGYFVAPLIWLILESIYPSMFPIRIATLIADSTPLIQACSVFGVLGASLQVFLLASLVPLAWSWMVKSNHLSRSHVAVGIATIALLTTVNFVFGWQRTNSFRSAESNFSGEYLNVGLIQGTTGNATSHLEFGKRSRELVKNGAELILWPECAFGKYKRDLADFSNDYEVAKKSMGIGYRFRPLSNPQCHLLGGGYSWSEKDSKGRMTARFVSAFLLDPAEQLVGRHDKIQLMAGGEFIPFESCIPQIRDWVGQAIDTRDPEGVPLSRGTEVRPIGTVKGVSIGAILCCEDMYSEISRQLISEGADVIACLTNGVAFESKIAINQHFNLGRFRAVENNCYLVRCSSHGISCLVRPDGSVVNALPSFSEQDCELRIPIENREHSFYCRYGDILTPACALILAGLSLVSIMRRGQSQLSI